MEIYFKTRKMQRACSTDKLMLKKWGKKIATKLKQRLVELRAVVTLEEMGRLPAARCHSLSGDRKGQLAVDLAHPHRLVFVPNHDPVPQTSEGGLDWSRVTSVLVLEITDYH